MKKKFTVYGITVFIISLLVGFGTKAQGIYQLWGTTTQGAEANTGTLFSTKADGTGHKQRPAFTWEVSGRGASNQVPVAYNNKLYGLIRYGGMHDDGLVYEFDPATGVYTKMFDLFYIGGSHPYGDLVLHNNKLYGMTSDGGEDDFGIIFQFDPVTHACVKKRDFTYDIASYPVGNLTWFNNKFYGLLRFAGSHNGGAIFEYDPATNTLVKKYDFETPTGVYPVGSLKVFNNLLWSTTFEGGAFNKGTVFSYNPATNVHTKKIDLTDANGSTPDDGFVLYDNKFYGLTIGGGAADKGVLYEYNPINNSYTKKIDLTDNLGTHPRGDMVVYNSKLYGTITGGGQYGKGVLFEYNPANNNYVVKVNLNEQTGHFPWGGLSVYNNKMYGLTDDGGSRGNGVLFEYDPLGNNYTKKVELGSFSGRKPEGNLVHIYNKIYGITSAGGEAFQGIIYEYDLATHVFTVRKHMTSETGNGSNGLMLHDNGKIYGLTSFGGLNDVGTLFEFNPATNSFTKLYDFNYASGQHPKGVLTSFNGKLYGGTARGGSASDMGTIFEFNPATNVLAAKVVMSATFGKEPNGGMVLHNNKSYGTCLQGGASNQGTLFEYNPVINSYVKKFDFDGAAHGANVRSGLEMMNGKLYGVASGGSQDHGMIFEYVPGASTVTNVYNFSNTGVHIPYCTLLANNNKLFGVANGSPSPAGSGSVFEFDPATATVDLKTEFFITNGAVPGVTKLLKVPAVVAPGDSGNCATSSGLIDNANNNEWVPFTNENGDAVAEIKANGNSLGRVLVKYYVHNGPTRQDGNGNMYLNRNISIEVDNQPATPVSIRLYIRKTEFETLKATPGSGLFTHGQLQLFKNNDACGNAIIAAATPIPTTPSAWGADYVYIADVSSFSSFYFAKNTVTSLPINIISFKGTREVAANRLEWTAACSNNVDFAIERSVNGSDFQAIGFVKALQQDCNHPFTFPDKNPPAKAWYRLRTTENNGSVKFSAVILLQREGNENLMVSMYPNPVTSSQASLQINAVRNTEIVFTVTDVVGRVMLRNQVQVKTGVSSIQLPVNNIPAGVYQLVYNTGEKNQIIRFVKQ